MHVEIPARATVGYLVRNDTVNLPWKKRGVGAGRRNGYGGGILYGESRETGCVREILEEGRVKTWGQDLQPVALLRCHNRMENGQTFLCTVFVFQTSFWLGFTEPKESDEMGLPAWFPINALPLQELLPADQLWLPRFFKERKLLLVTARYGPNQKTLDEAVTIEEIESLPEE